MFTAMDEGDTSGRKVFKSVLCYNPTPFFEICDVGHVVIINWSPEVNYVFENYFIK